MDGDEKVLIANLQSARDRMMKALPPLVGDAFDGDFDTMLEAINALKKTATPPESAQPDPLLPETWPAWVRQVAEREAARGYAAGVSSAAQPVGEVDEAVVDRFCEAYSKVVPEDCLGLVRRKAIKDGLRAARLPAQGAVAWHDSGYGVIEDSNGREVGTTPGWSNADRQTMLRAVNYTRPAAATGDGVDDEYVYRLVTHYETMRSGAVSFTPNAHALHCMKAALIAAAPAHRQQGDDDER